jgi:hypothetical protein
MPYITTEVEVYVDLADFHDDDIREEFERRGLAAEMISRQIDDRLQEIYELRQQGRDYDNQLNQMIYDTIGRIS